MLVREVKFIICLKIFLSLKIVNEIQLQRLHFKYSGNLLLGNIHNVLRF